MVTTQMPKRDQLKLNKKLFLLSLDIHKQGSYFKKQNLEEKETNLNG